MSDIGNAQKMRQQLLEKQSGNAHNKRGTGLGSLADQYVITIMTNSLIASTDTGAIC